MWHLEGGRISEIYMSEGCRAPLWYDKDISIFSSNMHGTKALRECDRVTIDNCKIESAEFGWYCRDINIQNSILSSEYPFLHTKNMEIDNLTMSGKYSFQYVKNLHIINSTLDTKDAFWHAENVIVENSTVIGEYLGWYSKNLTFINCHIKGTQPLCYCENLKLINCTMEDTDLSFEYSSVEANVIGHIDSIKNPLSGTIICDSVEQIIFDSTVKECLGKITIREKKVA